MQNILTSLRQHRRLLAQTAALALVYYAGARLGLMLAFEQSNSTPVWPPAGIALAGMLLCGWRVWPGVWLGAFVANAVVFAHHHAAAPFTVVWVSAAIACGNTLEALCGRLLCDRWLARSSSEDVVSGLEHQILSGNLGVFQFAAMGLISATLSAWVGPVAVTFAGIAPWSDFPIVWINWWFGDASAMLLLAPFLVILRDLPLLGKIAIRWKEIAAAFGLLALVTGAVFGEWFGINGRKLPITFLTIIPLIWIALRIGLRGTITALVLLAASAIWNTHQGLGPFAQPLEGEALLLLLSYLWIISCTSLTLAGTVAARQHSHTSLQAANAALEATMEAIPALVMIAHDPECRRITGNHRAHEMLRIPLGSDLSMNTPEPGVPSQFEVRVRGQRLPNAGLPMQKAAATGQAVTGQELELVFHNGDVRFIFGNAVPIFDGNGATRGCVAAFMDITAHKRADRDLHESEERFRTMAESAPVLIWMSGEDKRRVYFNRTWLEFTGRSMAQELEGDWAEGVHPDDLQRCLDVYTSSFDARRAFRMEYRLKRHDGEYRWLMDHGVPRYAAGEHFAGYIGSCVDVTESKIAGDAVRRSETLLRSITDHSTDMIFAKDDSSRIVFMNNAGLRIVGLPLEKIIGHTDTEIHVDTAEAAAFLTNDQRVMEMRMTETVEETLTTASGSKLTLMTTKTPRFDSAGNVVGIVGVARDVTEFKRTQDELCRLNEELEKRVALRTSALQRANEELNREIAERQRLENDILHIAEREQRRLGQYLHEELSQHLVGIGFLCRVLSDKLNEENHPKARGVSELAAMLQEALDSTRDLAKSYYPVELETGGLITALQSLAERTSRLFGVNCKFESDENLPFFSDSQSAIHFYRIVQEAVTNALKHGKATHIIIQCKTTDGRECITITDDGRGFNPQNASTGLGLHFMRYRARLIGAEMEVRKTCPNGCSVTCAMKGRQDAGQASTACGGPDRAKGCPVESPGIRRDRGAPVV